MLDELEKEGYIKKIKTNPKKVKDLLALARRDLKIAQRMLKDDYDWSFNIAYNSMLQSIRALMFQKGYRPSSHKSHIAVVKFTEEILGEDYSIFLDRMRRKRHRAVYDISGSISQKEAESAVKRAVHIVEKINELIKT